MTEKDLNALILALPPEEALRLIEAVAANLAASVRSVAGDTDAARAVREIRESYFASQGGSKAMDVQVQLLLEKFAHLSPERQAEVGDFIEFLHQREKGQLNTSDFSRAAATAFAKVWDNDDDAVYDKL